MIYLIRFSPVSESTPYTFWNGRRPEIGAMAHDPAEAVRFADAESADLVRQNVLGGRGETVGVQTGGGQ